MSQLRICCAARRLFEGSLLSGRRPLKVGSSRITRISPAPTRSPYLGRCFYSYSALRSEAAEMEQQVTVQQNGETKTVGAHNAWIGYAGAAGTDLRSE